MRESKGLGKNYKKKNVSRVKKKLYRNPNNKIIAGVCSGIADYLNIDPFIIRLIWAAVMLFFGIGGSLYIFCALIIPVKPSDYHYDHEYNDFNEVEDN